MGFHWIIENSSLGFHGVIENPLMGISLDHRKSIDGILMDHKKSIKKRRKCLEKRQKLIYSKLRHKMVE